MKAFTVAAGIALMALLLATSVPAHASSVQTCVAQPGSSCTLTFNLNNGDQVSGSVSISGGSGNDVNFYITDPAGAQIYNAGRVSGGTTFSFQASSSGAYILYFDNSFSLISSKTITVSYNSSPTLIPGASPETSYAIVIVVIILVLVIIALAVRRGHHRTTPQQAP
jgi:hypothetical protein